MSDVKSDGRPESNRENRPGADAERPSWWSSAQDLSWNKVKAGLLEEWRRFEKDAGELDRMAQEQAVKFGHGARAAYAKLTVWSAELEQQLKADWEAMGARQTFEKVRSAIRHGWEETVKDVKK